MTTPNITQEFRLDYVENNIGKREKNFMDTIGQADDGKLYLKHQAVS